MGPGYSVYYDAITGRPQVCGGDAPTDADFVAAFHDPGDAGQLRSELASARVVELGLVRRNPLVDDRRGERVQVLYRRARQVAAKAPFAPDGGEALPPPSRSTLFVTVPTAVGPGAVGFAGPRDAAWVHGFVVPAQPPL